MRKLIARAGEFSTYNTANEAIAAGKRADLELRTLFDEQVRGKTVRDVLFDDARLSLGLDDGWFLNFVAQARRVICSLDETPKAVKHTAEQDDELLVLDNSSWEWHRTDLARNCMGKPLEGLFFGEVGVWIYMPRFLVMCRVIESENDRTPWLYWEESQ